jgi:hypothetical protein
MKKKDKTLYLALLLLIIAAALLSSRIPHDCGDLSLEIRSDGRIIKNLALRDIAPGTQIVINEGGGMNEMLVSGDSVQMISSDCPGGDCLRMTPLTSERGVIVCLPHKLVIKLRAKKSRVSDDAIDTITY